MQAYRVIALVVALIGLIGNAAGLFDVLKDIAALKRLRLFYGSYRTNILDAFVNELGWALVQAVLVLVGVMSVFQISMPILIRTVFMGLSIFLTLRSFNAARARHEWRKQWREENHE